MQEIYSWLLSIAGVVIFGSVIDMILPEGNIRKYIQGIYALAVMLVILLPLPSLMNKSFNTDSFFQKTEIDGGYIQNIYKNRISLLEQSIIYELESMDIKNVKITIITDNYSENMKILQVIADVSQNSEASRDAIISAIIKQTSIESEKISFI